ncbi:MAG TPA: Gfo/Idh/MocA family oxidoreductase, partial [Paracoccaceae bacterium]|nr:Gfo/Idh/MocA family oxidoreductase [Paracoccaceae bacterium]
MHELLQSLSAPETPKAIVIFGAGSIVRDAHLPAYRRAGFPVSGIFDPDIGKAAQLAAEWDTRAFESIGEAAGGDVIFDLAVPPAAIPRILDALPDGATVLIQKPMGADLAAADEILALCRAKNLNAAVNFQLRFAPMSLALKDAIAKGIL